MPNYIEKINLWFGRKAATIIRFRWFIFAVATVVTALAIFGLGQLKMENSAESWLLESDPLRVAKEEFEDIFGNNDFVIVLIEADDVFSHDVLAMMRELGDELEQEVPLAREDGVTSLTHLEFTRGTDYGINVDDLVPERIPTDPAELEEIRNLAMSKEFLRDRLFSVDGTRAAILLQLRPYPTDTGITDMEYMTEIEEATAEILAREEYADYTFLASGVPILGSEKLKFLGAEGTMMLRLTVLVLAILLAVSFRSVVAVIAPILTAALSAIWVLGAMGWLGVKVQDIVLVIPILLVLVVSVGYNVHILSFFRQKLLETGERRNSIAHALQNAGWPLLFTALTTALGFLSFLVFPVQPIRWLGYTSASLVVGCYPILMLLTPALLSFGRDHEPHPEYVEKGGGRFERLLVGLGEWVRIRGVPIVVIFAAVTLVFAVSMFFVRIDTDTTGQLGRQVPFVDKAFRVAESIGSMYAYDVTLNFPEEGMAKDPAALQSMETLAGEIRQFNSVKRTSSINDIVRDLNRTLNEDDPAYYVIPDNPALVAQLLLLYEMSGGTNTEDWVDYEYRTLRLNVELDDYSSQEAESQIDFVQTRAAELLPEATVGMTGTAVILGKMINYLVDGQIRSVLLAIICICVVMMLVFGSLRLGLIGMVPNFAPVVFAIGAMAMLDTPLHMMTIMIAPMVIGIAVDDTIHYINHFKQAFLRTGSYAAANRETFRTVGKAIFLTSSIICLGFAMMLASRTNAYTHMGFYTILAVTVALLADYLITPVLIIWTKPFGPEKAVAGNSD